MEYRQASKRGIIRRCPRHYSILQSYCMQVHDIAAGRPHRSCGLHSDISKNVRVSHAKWPKLQMQAYLPDMRIW